MDQNVVCSKWRALGIGRARGCDGGRERETDRWRVREQGYVYSVKPVERSALAVCSLQHGSRRVTMSLVCCPVVKWSQLSPCEQNPLRIIRIYYAYHPSVQNQLRFAKHAYPNTHTVTLNAHSLLTHEFKNDAMRLFPLASSRAFNPCMLHIA